MKLFCKEYYRERIRTFWITWKAAFCIFSGAWFSSSVGIGAGSSYNLPPLSQRPAIEKNNQNAISLPMKTEHEPRTNDLLGSNGETSLLKGEQINFFGLKQFDPWNLSSFDKTVLLANRSSQQRTFLSEIINLPRGGFAGNGFVGDGSSWDWDTTYKVGAFLVGVILALTPSKGTSFNIPSHPMHINPVSGMRPGAYPGGNHGGGPGAGKDSGVDDSSQFSQS